MSTGAGATGPAPTGGNFSAVTKPKNRQKTQSRRKRPAREPTPRREFANLPIDPDIKVPECVRRAAPANEFASPKTDHQCGSPVNRATNGAAAPVSSSSSSETDETGLAALADPKTFEDIKRKMPVFRDLTVKGKPRASLANAVIAINALGIEARQDLFHHRIIVKHRDEAPTIREGVFTDDTIGAIRSLINNKHRIDCGDANTLAAIKEIARNHSFDPVLDYLDECQSKWDGEKPIDTWVINYMGVEDTPLHRAIGRIMLIASVRRARNPGCKFDQICVLESEEGYNKSTAIKVMAGEENFSDQSVLNVGEREAQEQLEGIWLHESADLTSLKKAEVERVKAFASRQFDRARPAYGRVREDRPRRCTQWATTNDDAYLASQTGNRRFWPLPVGRIDIDALRRDRDQLWGEAATLEASGASIVLDPELWPAEHEEQDKRRIVDPWEDLIENMPAFGKVREGSYLEEDVQIIYQSHGMELVRSADVLVHILKVPIGQQHAGHGKRLAQVMKRCSGWQSAKSGRVSILGKQCRGYWRPLGLPAASSVLAGPQLVAAASIVPAGSQPMEQTAEDVGMPDEADAAREALAQLVLPLRRAQSDRQ